MDRLIAVLRANRELLPEVISNDAKAEAANDKPSSEVDADALLR
jgi:hypothetical protein